MQWKYGFPYSIHNNIIRYTDAVQEKAVEISVLKLSKDSLIIKRDSFIESYYKVAYNIDTVPKPDKIYYSPTRQVMLGDAPDFIVSIDNTGLLRTLGLYNNDVENGSKMMAETRIIENGDTLLKCIAIKNYGFSNFVTGITLPKWVFDTIASNFRKANFHIVKNSIGMAGMESTTAYATFLLNNRVINSFRNQEYPMELIWAYSTLRNLAYAVKADLKKIKPKYDIPIPFALKVNAEKEIRLTYSEGFMLYDLINDGRLVNINFEPALPVYYGGFMGRASEEQVNAKSKDDTIKTKKEKLYVVSLKRHDWTGGYKSMTYNGPYFKMVYDNNDSLTIDIGVDVFHLLHKNIWE